MDGFIPLVCKALKKSQTRRKYECLSTPGSAAPAPAQTYNISDFYPPGFRYQYPETPQPAEIKAPTTNPITGHHHSRRHNSSVGEYSSGFSEAGKDMVVITKQPNKQLVRFRSHRFFSCVTGGV